MNYFEPYIDQIADLCRRYNVRRLFAFGSVLTDNFNDESDIDLLVDIAENDPLKYADNYFNLKFSLLDLFNRQVDLLEDRSIRNPYLRKNIENSKLLIYGWIYE